MLNDIKTESSVANGDSLKIIDIVSPRRTLVLSERPTFRWNEVPGASFYLVSLMDGSEIYWHEKVSELEIVYPGNPPLKRGVSYSLVIKSDNNFSSESILDKPELKFNLLDLESVQKIESSMEEISRLNLEPEVEALVLTTLYIEHGLNAKAVKTLEKLRVDGIQAFVVDRTLSELYKHIGLNVLSEERSKTARELENAIDAIKTNSRLEQEVMKVLEQQPTNNSSKEKEGANFLKSSTASFVLRRRGESCTTPEGNPGVWQFSPAIGWFCDDNGGG